MPLAPLGIVLLATVSTGQRPWPKDGRLRYSHVGAETPIGEGESISLRAIRKRGADDAIGWDEYGRTRGLTVKPLPAAPPIPNRKVREFVFEWPQGVALSASVFAGGEVVQIVRDRTTASVTVAFPAQAQTGSLDVLDPTQVRKRLRAVPFNPAPAKEARFGEGLRWFTVAKPPERTQFRLFDAFGKPMEMLGQIQRKGDSQVSIAVLGTNAHALRKVELWSVDPAWYAYGDFLLDPVPIPKVRPGAPSQTLALHAGGEATLQAIEAVTPGRPYAIWAIDGKAPSTLLPISLNERGYYTGPNREGRQIAVRFEWPDREGLDPHYRWSTGHGEKASPFSLNGIDTRVVFAIPTGLERTDIGLEYAVGPWETLLEEELGGPQLKASSRLYSPATPHSPARVVVWGTIPEHLRDQDLFLQPLDRQGRPMPVKAHLAQALPRPELRDSVVETSSSLNVARVRLLTRPWRKAEFKAVPLQPLR